MKTEDGDRKHLKLTRRPGQCVIIDGPCTVRVEDVWQEDGRDRPTVQLGFFATEDVKILREELLKRDRG